MEFRGFLKDMHGWHSHKDSSSKLKGRAVKTATAKSKGNIHENKELVSKFSAVEVRKDDANVHPSSESTKEFNYLRNSNAFDPIFSSSINEEKLPDATSEKELGNDYFKQKKFVEAIECYSRSIALTPTSVALANRAMAYLKLKKFEEAENDCTDALNLDDHYVKAYSRRATSRKELMKLEEAMEDAEFAVRLEPNNPEIRKQYSEIKEMLGRKFVQNASGEKKLNAVSTGFQVKGNYSVMSKAQTVEASTTQTMEPVSDRRSDVVRTSLQDLVSRAVAQVTAENITTPTSAYQFEVSWRSLSNDSGKRTQLLKTIPPADLPKIFKNALSAPLLIDIVRCIAAIFRDDTILALSMIDYLAKVPRFDMLILCLSALDRAELHRLWEEVFLSDQTQEDLKQVLNRLRPKYLLK